MPATTALTIPSRRNRTVARLRSLVLLAVATLIVATGLTLSPAKVEALAPGAPKVTGLIGWDEQILFAWSLPNSGGKKPTGFVVERYLGDAAQPQKVWQLGGTHMHLIDSGVQNDTTYRYRVMAKNADGNSGWSAKEGIQAHDYRKPTYPFWDEAEYVERMYQDLLGRKPNQAELTFGKLNVIQNGPKGFVDELAHTDARVAERHPVIRLYFAFFERSPDLAGANYWISKRNNGMNLNQIASHFAGSSEFKSKYGNLTNKQFVTQVYVNVFDRQPDPNGLAYWTNKLSSGKATRGQVMVGFSESSEYAGSDGKVGRSTGRVEAADIWMAIMKTVPKAQDLDTYYANHIQFGGSQGVLAMVLMPTNGYPV